MAERRASSGVALVALATGLWMTGCATTEENGDTTNAAGAVATIAGQFVGGVLAGFMGAFGAQPAGYSSASAPAYSASAYNQSYSYPVHQSSRQHSHHHHHRR